MRDFIELFDEHIGTVFGFSLIFMILFVIVDAAIHGPVQ